MPLYEYKCNNCEKTFEVLQKISAEPLTTCLYCQGDVDKLISASSFQLKGSGWYVTDYKNKTSKAGTAGPTPTTSTASGKSENAVA
ncbi:MAG: zinc ribbon domain-containing protein [bacterium]|nr:zinc ribbon domain-containing protein [bacterium]